MSESPTQSRSPARPVSLPAVVLPVAFATWTTYVWVTRLVNAWGDAGLDTSERWGATVLAGSFLVLAFGVAWAALEAWRRRPSALGARAVRVLVVWTVIVWAVRVPQIVLAGHALGFTVVHVMLGVMSIGLGLVSAAVLGVFRRSPGAR